MRVPPLSLSSDVTAEETQIVAYATNSLEALFCAADRLKDRLAYAIIDVLETHFPNSLNYCTESLSEHRIRSLLLLIFLSNYHRPNNKGAFMTVLSAYEAKLRLQLLTRADRAALPALEHHLNSCLDGCSLGVVTDCALWRVLREAESKGELTLKAHSAAKPNGFLAIRKTKSGVPEVLVEDQLLSVSSIEDEYKHFISRRVPRFMIHDLAHLLAHQCGLFQNYGLDHFALVQQLEGTESGEQLGYHRTQASPDISHELYKLLKAQKLESPRWLKGESFGDKFTFLELAIALHAKLAELSPLEQLKHLFSEAPAAEVFEYSAALIEPYLFFRAEPQLVGAMGLKALCLERLGQLATYAPCDRVTRFKVAPTSSMLHKGTVVLHLVPGVPVTPQQRFAVMSHLYRLHCYCDLQQRVLQEGAAEFTGLELTAILSSYHRMFLASPWGCFDLTNSGETLVAKLLEVASLGESPVPDCLTALTPMYRWLGSIAYSIRKE